MLENYKLPTGTTEDDLKVLNCFYNEIFHENEYDRFGISVEEGDIVLDAGANIGMFTNYAVSKGAESVLSIECESYNYECLLENTHHEKTKVKHLHGFVSGQNSDLDNYYNLNKILNIMNVDKIHFAKIDIEGYEYDFILNASDEDIRRVNKWAIEVHYIFNHECAMNLLNIMDKFSKNNYSGYYTRIHLNTNLAMLYFTK